MTVRVDGGAPRRVEVTRQRLYTLASFPRTGNHALALSLTPGTSAYAFTFG